MDIASNSYRYQVGKLVAETDKYRLFLCKQEETGRQCLLQIATAVENNGALDRAAYILEELKAQADEVEKEYASVKTNPKSVLNYQLAFPEIVDNFICPEQGERRITVLAFRNIEDVSTVIPLINITAKDRLRVDLRTSGWIMGKFLKLLTFVHSLGFSIGLVNSNNILIEPNRRFVIVFDWSFALTHSTEVPMEIRQQEISNAAQAVIIVLGGDPSTGVIPNDGDEFFGQYTAHLLRLARGGESRAERGHKKFYELIESHWPREFYPFTTKPLID